MPELDTLTVKEAADSLSVSERTVRRLLSKGDLCGHKVDRDRGLKEWRVNADSVSARLHAVSRGQSPRETRTEAFREELRRAHEREAELRRVLELQAQAIGGLAGRIADLEATIQKLLPPHEEQEPERKPWWRWWR